MRSQTGTGLAESAPHIAEKLAPLTTSTGGRGRGGGDFALRGSFCSSLADCRARGLTARRWMTSPVPVAPPGVMRRSDRQRQSCVWSWQLHARTGGGRWKGRAETDGDGDAVESFPASRDVPSWPPASQATDALVAGGSYTYLARRHQSLEQRSHHSFRCVDVNSYSNVAYCLEAGADTREGAIAPRPPRRLLAKNRDTMPIKSRFYHS